MQERNESTMLKAGRLLLRLYLMRRMDFFHMTVDDILAKATDEEIDYYYYMICVREKVTDRKGDN